MTDLDRVRALVRELYRELDLAEPPKKVKVAETRWEETAHGSWQIDLDEDGNEVHRQFIPSLKIGHGLEPAGGE